MTFAELQWKTLSPPERALWRLLRLICRAEDASAGTLHLATIDLRSPSQQAEVNLRHATSEALERISQARGGFGELVTSHLQVVAVIPGHGQARVHPAAGAYVCPFTGPEPRNIHFWASQLVWAATVVRLARDGMHARGAWRQGGVRQAAWDAQVRFLHQFDDAEPWVEWLKAVGWQPAE